MEKTFLHVVSFTLTDGESITGALHHLQRLCPAKPSLHHALLLFCDLPPAPARMMPHEAPLIQKLLSGVTALHAHQQDGVFLLVRRRKWDDATRQYLGAQQKTTCRHVIAQLLIKGKTQADFEAASIPPASLKGKYSAVLFSDTSLFCTPDTPSRMYQALERRSEEMLGAQVLCCRSYPQSVLTRLCTSGCFSLSALQSAQEYAVSRQGRCPMGNPVIFTAEALIHCDASSVPAAEDCVFVRRHPQTARNMLRTYHTACCRAPVFRVLTPVVQMLALFAAAFSGRPFFTAASLLPEFWALAHPGQWPGVMLRAALVPITALMSLDALFCRLFSRSPLLRIRIAPRLFSPLGCALAAGFLLPAAFFSVHALFSLLPFGLLWLSTPLILRTLDMPTLERIPLDAQQLRHLHTSAENAYLNAVHSPSPALDMLSACAACMLGILEPDETARRIQALLSEGFSCTSCAEQAAALASAQYLRERMPDCDAALQPLPRQLEAAALAQMPESSGLLSSLLLSVRNEHGVSLPFTAVSDPRELLFLPLRPIREMPQHPLSLPLTHPHTYLKRHLPETRAQTPADEADASWRFLFLAAAALGHPFHALLLRSPVTGPYAAALI